MSTPDPQAEAKFSALIIDDNWFNRDIFRIALESAGYDVTLLENGLEGMKILEQQTFSLLVLDLQMPLVDGRAVLNAVRAHPLHRKMRVVVVTANAHMATSEVDEKADYVMYKPINVMEFSEFVRRLKNMAFQLPPVN
jgi:CheY-like chemotaxis protein